MTNENNYDYLLKIYEKVSDDVAPKDGKTYYWFNKRSNRIISEEVLERMIKEYEASHELFLHD